MSPASKTALRPEAPAPADKEAVVRRLAAVLLPRTKPDDLQVRVEHGETYLHVVPDNIWLKVTLDAPRLGECTLQRVDPTTRQPLPVFAVTELAIPPLPPPSRVTPRTSEQQAEALLAVSARLSTATRTARLRLQDVCSSVEDEVARLVASAQTFEPGLARGLITKTVTGGLGAALDFAQALQAAEQLLDQHGELRRDQAATVAAKRLAGSLVELAALRGAEQTGSAARTASVHLNDVVRDALVFADALKAAAQILAVAGVRAAAQLQITHTTMALTRLKADVARTRAGALELDASLVATVVQYGLHGGQPIKLPTLHWATPKDLFAGPTVSEG